MNLLKNTQNNLKMAESSRSLKPNKKVNICS